jgi:hypothetical protein
MKRAATLTAALALLLGGCASSLDPYSTERVPADRVMVLLGVDSTIPFDKVEQCDALLCGHYSLGGRREVMAYAARVGSTFRIDKIYTLDNRFARLEGPELIVDKRGIYYYGTLVATNVSVGITEGAPPGLLHAARRKYGNRFDALKPMNFAWPDPATDDLGLGYENSEQVQAALRPLAGKRVHVSDMKLEARFNRFCQAWTALSLPDYLPYEEFVRRAFNQELAAAGLHGEGAGATALTGALTSLSFSTTGHTPNWTVGMRLVGADGRGANAKVTVPFEAPSAMAEACPAAEDAWPDAAQKLLEALVRSPEFEGLLAGGGQP